MPIEQKAVVKLAGIVETSSYVSSAWKTSYCWYPGPPLWNHLVHCRKLKGDQNRSFISYNQLANGNDGYAFTHFFHIAYNIQSVDDRIVLDNAGRSPAAEPCIVVKSGVDKPEEEDIWLRP